MRWPALLPLAACGGGGTPPAGAPVIEGAPRTIDAAPGPDFQAEADFLYELERRACACPDVPCLEEVDRAYAAFADVTTLSDPVGDVEVWPDELDRLTDASVDRINACFEKLAVPLTQTWIHFALRELEGFADHACECADDACLETTFEAFGGYDRWTSLARIDKDRVLAARARGDVNRLARCLAPVLQDEVADTLVSVVDFRDRTCACTDLACAMGVAQDLSRWIAADMTHTMVVLPDQRVIDVFESLNTCLRALGAPMPPP